MIRKPQKELVKNLKNRAFCFAERSKHWNWTKTIIYDRGLALGYINFMHDSNDGMEMGFRVSILFYTYCKKNHPQQTMMRTEVTPKPLQMESSRYRPTGCHQILKSGRTSGQEVRRAY